MGCGWLLVIPAFNNSVPLSQVKGGRISLDVDPKKVLSPLFAAINKNETVVNLTDAVRSKEAIADATCCLELFAPGTYTAILSTI